MHTSILAVLNDTPCSRIAVEFLTRAPLKMSDTRVTLLHVWRQPAGSEKMMGRRFLTEQQAKVEAEMADARRRLVAAGYPPDQVHIQIEKTTYPTVADGIIAAVDAGGHDMVVMGRKNMSKSEEFVLGDASIKVVRALERATVVVVKC